MTPAWLRWAPVASACLGLAALADQPALTKGQAEALLAELKTAITELQEELSRSRERMRNEQAQLRAMDLDIQSAALELREVAQRIDQEEAKLTRLQAEREAHLAELGARSDELSQHVAAAYRSGHESRLKLLLNQDDPARLGRLLAYFDYLSAAQARQVGELRTVLAELEAMQARIDEVLAELRRVEDERQRALNTLQGGRAERGRLLADLGRLIDSTELRLEELQGNQADLEALLQRLAEALTDIPTELGQYRHPREHRGQLPMPVEGRVLRSYGQSRAGGMNWQGWLIGADNGTEVRAIAYGRVAYADWLRGYGLLIIIDHGDGFMSLYGNNEALLFEPGDWVQPGEAIATVGNNPGAEQGLYFELRSKGTAIDPAAWVKRR